MIIILEGCDGSGKSTLATKLHEVLSMDRDTVSIHHGPYKGVETNELAKLFFGSMTQALTYNTHVIMDRSWYSEPIYAKIYRNQESRIPMEYRRMLERAALSRNAVVIKCQPSFDACAEAFGARDEMLDNEDQLKQVYDAYAEWGENFTSIRSIDYNYETMDFEHVLKQLRVPNSLGNRFLGGGSYAKGNTLILCSRWKVMNVRHGAVTIPYINFNENFSEPPSASALITSCLEDMGMREKDLYWVNVEDNTGRPLNTGIINELQPKHVIAIGSQPKQWCKSNGIEAIFVPQPTSDSFNLGDLYAEINP